jgi:hypothetical protein
MNPWWTAWHEGVWTRRRSIGLCPQRSPLPWWGLKSWINPDVMAAVRTSHPTSNDPIARAGPRSPIAHAAMLRREWATSREPRPLRCDDQPVTGSGDTLGAWPTDRPPSAFTPPDGRQSVSGRHRNDEALVEQDVRYEGLGLLVIGHGVAAPDLSSHTSCLGVMRARKTLLDARLVSVSDSWDPLDRCAVTHTIWRWRPVTITRSCSRQGS